MAFGSAGAENWGNLKLPYKIDFDRTEITVVSGVWTTQANNNQTLYSPKIVPAPGFYYSAYPAVNHEVKWANLFLRKGVYKLYFVTWKNDHMGIVEFLLGTRSIATLDLYNPTSIYNVPIKFTFNVMGDTTLDFRIRVKGHNPLSLNSYIIFSWLTLETTG
jgi:hypothetical protein